MVSNFLKRQFFFTSLAIFLFIGNSSFSQIFSPTCDWSTSTQYVWGDKQDSVFLFFSSSENPVLGELRAQFSDSSAAIFRWFKYNENLPLEQRFVLLPEETDSLADGLTRGGYKVEVQRIADDSTEVYTTWVMIDDVEIESLEVWNNHCERLILEMKTLPLNSWDISQLFSYYDLSISTQQERSILTGGGYFRNNQFLSDNIDVQSTIPTLSSSPFIYIEFENELNGTIHGPLKDATYTIKVTNPFNGQVLQATTEEVPAISTTTNFDIWFNEGDELLEDWKLKEGETVNGEALLEVKLEAKPENADSVIWRIINDPYLFARGRDSILWKDSSLFSSVFEFYPPKELMIPGVYSVESISLNTIAGCRDTLYKTIEVDTSFIKSEAIPNVFSPNGDGVNDFFVLKEPGTNVMSIKQFQITILSRWGKQVYYYSGDPKTWEGWNGKIHGDKGDAAEGVYYFVMDAIGWDGKRFRDKQYKGFLHLFR
ncbi:MAG TPA: gliding motility-associated C-terminal domain-containing protein [Tenuifilaceae bacterium]|nr:gliding motility-associated C-terminal domain-containing protein [Tenuifilaceae bacterium]HPE18586.1 gliding motility-associated C-terminal domain-containing protein [Tenuifilaceae bacterium]HPJ46043.1 gliding motility-associated C-terminal domain-containing protein [Tenuifilaceae bacterium]HPQ34746.1 gliding motility-associated C-terminal domain-containing protein [Tenuifilaceae bacterium]HRX67375.1 gliding motility-associated C-terminal domain-containing protein [Tenuifilaceae bacterium]